MPPPKPLFLLESARREERCPTFSAPLGSGPGSVPKGHLVDHMVPETQEGH